MTPEAVSTSKSAAGQDLEVLAARYIEATSRLSPIEATLRGDHRFDNELPDLSAAGRAAGMAVDRDILNRLEKIERSKLSRDDQIDAALLANAVRYDLWDIETMQSWAWNAQLYNDAAASALYSLAARDFAPWPQRPPGCHSTHGKAAGADRPGSGAVGAGTRAGPSYATTVAKQNAGVMDIVTTMLAPHADELTGADRVRFEAAKVNLAEAVNNQQHWLETVLIPQAKGDFRIGAKRYDEKMRFTLMSDLSRPELKARAVAALADTPRPDVRDRQRRRGAAGRGTGAANRADARAAAGRHQQGPRPSPMRNAPRATRWKPERAPALVQATDFVRSKDLVTLPDGPVRFITMPKFQQGNAVAYCDPPGPLERDQQTFVAISPIPDDWTADQATSFLREYNNYMVQDLVVHEAMPGHYLQLDHANRNPSTLRALLASGSFMEGWAVYAEGMMMDQGYLGGDPLFKLTVLKMRLRSIANTLLDIGIQTENMPRAQAMTLMTEGAFQQEREAAGKWTRASLSSTQLLNYFSGYTEQVSLRDDVRRRLGDRFSLKIYNDAVLAHGSPPPRFIRELLLDLPIE